MGALGVQVLRGSGLGLTLRMLLAIEVYHVFPGSGIAYGRTGVLQGLGIGQATALRVNRSLS